MGTPTWRMMKPVVVVCSVPGYGRTDEYFLTQEDADAFVRFVTEGSKPGTIHRIHRTEFDHLVMLNEAGGIVEVHSEFLASRFAQRFPHVIGGSWSNDWHYTIVGTWNTGLSRITHVVARMDNDEKAVIEKLKALQCAHPRASFEPHRWSSRYLDVGLGGRRIREEDIYDAE